MAFNLGNRNIYPLFMLYINVSELQGFRKQDDGSVACAGQWVRASQIVYCIMRLYFATSALVSQVVQPMLFR